MVSAEAVKPKKGPWARSLSGGLPADDPLRALPTHELVRLLDDIIESWPTDGLSDHLAREVAAVRMGALPLKTGARVPACVCPDCTGIPNDLPAWTLRTPAYAREMDRWASWETRVEQARAVPLLEVVQRLGLGDPVRQGKELAVRCPLHDDTDPSLRIDPVKQLWYCHPCGEGGDGLQLMMRVRRLSFAEAVRELAA